MPAVSVCIATYNHARFLPRCLDSILAQTCQDFEIVVVNDGSTDNTHEIMLGYQDRYPEKVRYFWHPGHANRGISITTNRAIQESCGKYIAFIGSDDTWLPEKLELQIALLEQHPEYGYVYSYAEYIDEDDQILPTLYGVDITQDPNPTGRMILSNPLPAMSVIVPRACLDEIGWLDESLVYGDWDLMIRLTALWPAGFTDRPLARYRIHGKNISQHIDPTIDLKRMLAVILVTQRKSIDVGGKLLAPRNQALFNLQLSFLYFCLGDKKISIDNLQRAFEVDETLKSDIQFFDEWLGGWKPDFYTTSHPNFGLWLIDHLPEGVTDEDRQKFIALQLGRQETQQFFIKRGIERGQANKIIDEIFSDVSASIPLPNAWKGQLLDQIYRALLFKAFQDNEMAKVRYFWLAIIRHDLSWLMHPGALSIGLQAFVHPKLIRFIRGIVKSSSSA